MIFLSLVFFDLWNYAVLSTYHIILTFILLCLYTKIFYCRYHPRCYLRLWLWYKSIATHLLAIILFPQWKLDCILPLEYPMENVNSLCTWKPLSFSWLSPQILLPTLKTAFSIAKFKPNHTWNKLFWKKILLLSVTESILLLVHSQT